MSIGNFFSALIGEKSATSVLLRLSDRKLEGDASSVISATAVFEQKRDCKESILAIGLRWVTFVEEMSNNRSG
jgi:hypothetical protein